MTKILDLTGKQADEARLFAHFCRYRNFRRALLESDPALYWSFTADLQKEYAKAHRRTSWEAQYGF